MEFNSKALNIFIRSLDDKKPWTGINAKDWASYFLNDVSPNLDKKFRRYDLTNEHEISNLTNEKLAIAILSWGAMNREHGKSLFSRVEWFEILTKMRQKSLNRKESFEGFKKLRMSNRLAGMGPAYFTKLICFVNRELNGYIMDQWTSKSMNVLLIEPLIHLNSNGYVTDRNSSDTYEAFCNYVEQLSEIINLSPIDTEEALFSYGGRRKGLWRQFVINSWNCYYE